MVYFAPNFEYCLFLHPMNLLRQVTQLLSESPGNIVYHLVTLFALQAVFAISFSQWRRSPKSKLASRFAIASTAVILGRILLLILVLSANILSFATAVMPLLEQALNTITVLLILWAIVPPLSNLPRLNDLIVFIGILIVLAITISFLPGWQTAAGEGIAYNSTSQAVIWTMIQIGLLAAGLLVVLLNSVWRQTLSPMIITVMLLSQLFHLFNFPEIIPGETNIAYWVRLGHLVAFPLWAVMAYRQSLLPMLRQAQQEPSSEKWRQLFTLAEQTIEANSETSLLTAVVQLADALLDVPYVFVGSITPQDRTMLHIISNQPQPEANAPMAWHLTISDWAAFQAALNQKRAIELNMAGAGANQLHRFSEMLAVGTIEALIIQPILHKNRPEGVLVVGQRETSDFSEEIKSTLPALAQFLSTLLKKKRETAELEAAESREGESQYPPVSPESNEVISGKIINLEQERQQLREALETARNRFKRAEERSIEATERARDLAASLDVLEQERINQTEEPELAREVSRLGKERSGLLQKIDELSQLLNKAKTELAEKEKQQHQPASSSTRVGELEREVETLRESLIEAEEALAMAAAGEGEISTEWVMLTITRYSGQLEQAQARIELLEKELKRRAKGGMDEMLISVIQELRTPMTSITGFTDLLLGGSLGILGVKQRDLLQRIQANTDRMGVLLDQIMQLTPDNNKKKADDLEQIDVREAVETAVNSVMTQIRKKRIHLDMDISADLPQLTIRRNEFHQIMSSLLGNACLASGSDGHIAVSAYSRELNGSQEEQSLSFVELCINDSGDGISTEDLNNVFAANYSADTPLIAGIGDTTAGLSLAHSLTLANGGRLWVDSEKGKGSTFTVLFPTVPPTEMLLNGN